MEQPMFLREHFNGMYRTDVYVICKMLADLPFQLFYSFLFIALPYYPIGFHPDVGRFFICVAILVLVATVAASFGKQRINSSKTNRDGNYYHSLFTLIIF